MQGDTAGPPASTPSTPPPTMATWELTARERIRDTLARYNWAGDALRVDDLADVFCDDGVLEIRGRERVEGLRAIAELLLGVGASAPAPPPGGRRIVRHHVTNVEFLQVTPAEARVRSYFAVTTEIGLDHVGRYRDTLVPVGDTWLIRHRFVSTDWWAADTTMPLPDDGADRP